MHNAECKIVRVQETKINTCIGCETCMVSHLKGNWDFRCIHKNGSDHFYFIEQLMREADAIIVTSPAYNLLPTGQLIKFLNKVHASGKLVHKGSTTHIWDITITTMTGKLVASIRVVNYIIRKK